MSEGLFKPDQLQIPGLASDRLCAAMVRILPTTVLALDIVETAQEAAQRASNEALSDGSECWHRYFTAADMAKMNDPEFAMGMVRHEFARLVRSGAKFPAIVPLDGGGSGFAIDAAGSVLTNYHLVTAEIATHHREAGALGSEMLCRSLRAQIAVRTDDCRWAWRDATAVWLVSNPPTTRAIHQDASGAGQLREDIALLRIEPCPSAHLNLSDRPVAASEPIWMAGFPLRSARSDASLAALGYADADGSLRVSSGRVLEVHGAEYFSADVDGSMGTSGSPVFDSSGEVVGMFSRVVGNGPRNAFAYGHVKREMVSARLIRDGLSLDALLTR